MPRRDIFLCNCLFLILILTCFPASYLVKGSEAEAKPEFFNVIDKLHAKLLLNYSRDIRPVVVHTDTLEVSVSFTLTNFDFNELESRFSARGFFYMRWKDPRFIWSPMEYEGLKSIHLPSEKVWKPDFEVYNSAGIIIENRSFAASEILVTSDGYVLFVPLSNLVSTCIADPTLYPFDKVTCLTTIGSWTHNEREIIMNLKDNQTKVNLEDLVNPKISSWSLLDTNMSLKTTIYSCCPDEPYQSLKIEYKMLRSLAKTSTIIAQAIVTMILTLAAFLIPPTLNSKLIIGMVNIILVCGNLLFFYSTLPSGTVNKTPLIVAFYCGSLIMAGLTILTSVLSLRWTRLPISSSPPVFVQKCLNSRVGCILGTNQDDHFEVKNIYPEKLQKQNSSNPNDCQPVTEVNRLWINVSMALDRILTIVYCGFLAYFMIGYHLG